MMQHQHANPSLPAAGAELTALNAQYVRSRVAALHSEASKGIVEPTWVLIQPNKPLWRFATKKYVGMDAMKVAAGPWWFGVTTYNIVVQYAARQYGVGAISVTPYMFASAARKLLAVWFNWSEMDVMVTGNLAGPVLALHGEGRTIRLSEAGTDAEKANHGHINMRALEGATQYYIPGLAKCGSVPALAQTDAACHSFATAAFPRAQVLSIDTTAADAPFLARTAAENAAIMRPMPRS